MKCVLTNLLLLKTKHKINQIVILALFSHPKQVPYQAEPRADIFYVTDIIYNLYLIASDYLGVIYAHLCSKVQAKTYECVNESVNTGSKPIGWLYIHYITLKNYIKFYFYKVHGRICGSY